MTFIKEKIFFIALSTMTVAGCTNDSGTENEPISINYAKGSFGYDRNFINKYDSTAVILRSDESKITVSAKYQDKVFTTRQPGTVEKVLVGSIIRRLPAP
jgi:hypothetical protein